MSADVDLRRIRYFVAVAETLSFRQAAERLRIAQPVLSRQIQVLEREMRVRLFDRGPRGTSLTPAGLQLLNDAPALLASSSDVAARARAAALDPTQRVVLGVMPGLLVTDAVQAFEGRHPECTVEVRRTTWQTQVSLVRDGKIDVSVVREPFSAEGLRAVRLTEEPRVAVLPRSSGFASNRSIGIAETADLLLLQDPESVTEWGAVAAQELVERAARQEFAVSVEEKLESVASGRGFVILPRSTIEFYRHPGVVRCELDGVGPSVIAMVARPTTESLVGALMDQLLEASSHLTGAAAARTASR
jgi:DNA-binding transcriptional LysR family regulator